MPPYKLTASLIISSFILLTHQSNLSYAEENLKQVPAIIHISSTVSDGKLALPEIMKIARENDIKVVILTDFDIMRWQYGLWPLRRIIRKTVEANSVFKYRIRRYLNEIDMQQKENPNLVIIPGVESSPFYYWEGSPFKGDLKLYNWYKHILVIGLERAGDYKNLPSVSNGYSLALPFRFKNILHLWPILILTIGLSLLRKREFDYRDSEGRPLGPYSRRWRVLGIVSIILGSLFLANNFPFRDFKYDQYHGDQDIAPYQNFINYVNRKGGFTFWAHPEAGWDKKVGNVSIEMKGPVDDLMMEASGYTGIAIFTYGYDLVARPGEVWDKVLKEYCEARREKPAWVIGGLGFDQKGDLSTYIKNLRTIFLVEDLNKADVLKALKEGRMYVVKGDAGLILDKFIIEDSLSDDKAIVGSDIDLKGVPILKISGRFKDGRSLPVKIDFIRDGAIVKTFEVTSPFEIEYQDDDSGEEKKVYYRLEINCQDSTIITNPIFVKFAKSS